MSQINVEFYKEQALKHLDTADRALLHNEHVKMIHDKSHIRPSFLAIGFSIVSLLLAIYCFGSHFVTNLIGFVYPLYESYRALALNQVAGATAAMDAQWLTYWIVFATFSLVESLTDFFLYWIPFYYVVKSGFLVWCFLPSTHGAEQIYHKVLEPVLIRYEGRIDGLAREGKRSANRVIADVARDAAAELKSAEPGEK